MFQKLLETESLPDHTDMQDFRSIPGLAGRIFGTVASGAAADHRRIRGCPGVGGGAIPEPPAKCPRCESTNTKFCYYNNYNLSQPRHFCKSCRRYWTKGGVLRNVPVGGGCRKSSAKRSSSLKKPSSKDRRRSAAESSSDSSGLTAASATGSNPAVFAPPASDDFDPAAAEQQTAFPEAGTFTNLMAVASASPPAFLGLNFSDPLPAVAEDARSPAPLIDPAGLTMEWPSAMDPALFDLAGDSGGYWNQGGGHWVDTDPNLYLP